MWTVCYILHEGEPTNSPPQKREYEEGSSRKTCQFTRLLKHKIRLHWTYQMRMMTASETQSGAQTPTGKRSGNAPSSSDVLSLLCCFLCLLVSFFLCCHTLFLSFMPRSSKLVHKLLVCTSPHPFHLNLKWKGMNDHAYNLNRIAN